MGSGVALLLTHSADFYTVDNVAAALERLGLLPVRIDTDLAGRAFGFEARFGRHPPRLILLGQPELDLKRVRAVWARRLWAPAAAFHELFELLRDARWVNPLAAQRAAESKMLQLELAAGLGLDVPPTLVTDRPAAVLAFHRRHGRLVTKLLEQSVQSMKAHPDFSYTTELEPRHYRALKTARFKPQIFQPLLEKEREVRLICVGAALLAGSIDPRRSKTGWLDWRRVQKSDGIAWQVERVPAAIGSRVRKMNRALGISYGAYDFIVQPGGRWTFLEVNPAGEYGWLERDLGLPISAAIAEAMAP